MNLKKQEQIAKDKLKELQNKVKNKISVKQEGKTKFYHFRQNNSGGSFDENENLCIHVFMEAHSAKEANSLADNIGIYFDGCSQDIDCSCCGDRWYEVSEGDGNSIPVMYGTKINEYYKSGYSDKCIIHYLNGKKKKVIFKTEKDCPKHKWKQQSDMGKQCEICGKWEKE